MSDLEDHFLNYNKLLEEKVDQLLHNVEARLDKIFERTLNEQAESNTRALDTSRVPNLFSHLSYFTFQKPYIRDFRNFSGPSNQDVRQINQLDGSQNIEQLIKNTTWTKTAQDQLRSAVLDHYAQLHIVQLIKQKNDLQKQYLETTDVNKTDLNHKFRLIDEQIDQVRQRREERFFVPADRHDPHIDWCGISAKLSNTHHGPSDCRLLWVNKLHWAVNDSLWTRDEDTCLIDAVEKHGTNDWDSVASEMSNGRLPWQCCARYHEEYSQGSSGVSPMTNDDINKITEVINLCRIGNYVPWNQVMYFIQYHNITQVKYQWLKLRTDVKSSQPWSHHEDNLLLRLVEQFGFRDWTRISSYIPNRSNKSCRERFMMRLKYNKRAIFKWQRCEDRALLSLVEKYGSNWTLISHHFPQRNNHQLRSRYELLRNNLGTTRTGPIKHKKLCRDTDGHLVVSVTRKSKQPSDQQVDDALSQILTSYQDVKPNAKSLVCRSVQDEVIYHRLVQTIKGSLMNEKVEQNVLDMVIKRAFDRSTHSESEFMSPCIPTLCGFKAWSLQQDYLQKLSGQIADDDVTYNEPLYHQVLKIIISLFLWPAILSKVKVPTIDARSLHPTSIIVKDTRNLYKIREIQKNLVVHASNQ